MAQSVWDGVVTPPEPVRGLVAKRALAPYIKDVKAAVLVVGGCSMKPIWPAVRLFAAIAKTRYQPRPW